MKEKVYVFGHKNPDTDSICSAIAYANLKGIIDDQYEYTAVMLGEANNETSFVLEQVGVSMPKVIEHLKPQVSDLDLTPVEYVSEDASIQETLEKIMHHTGRSMPVVGKYNHLSGVVSISDILPLYMSMDGQDFLKKNRTSFESFMDQLKLVVCHGRQPSGVIEGRVILFDDLKPEDKLTKKDIIFAGKSIYQKGALDTNEAGYIVLGNMELGEHIQSRSNQHTILGSVMSTGGMMKVINQIVSIREIVKKDNLEYFTNYETIDDVKKNLMTSRYRRFPVVDSFGNVIGMISRSDLLIGRQKKAILVDHNEKGQSIKGIEEITLLEVIDHHRVADIQTMGPLYFRVEPVGCTSTIVAKMYDEHNVTINKTIAKLMLSAILSDTLLFKSPTSTQVDEDTAKRLAKIAEVDLQLYGMSVIYAGSDFENLTPDEIVTSDMKRFMFGNSKVLIAQTNTSDFDGFFAKYAAILESMKMNIRMESAKLFVLLVTDVIVGGTELIAIGEDKWMAEQAFGVDSTENSIFLPGVFSRKKQVVPKLMQAAKL